MPSEKVLEVKKAQVAETVEILKAAQTGVLVDYRGLKRILNLEESLEKLTLSISLLRTHFFVLLQRKLVLMLLMKHFTDRQLSLFLQKMQLHLQRLLLILLRKTISLKLRQVSWTAL